MDNWSNLDKLKCVILCAGRGTRIIPYSLELPKSMIKINDKPILGWIIDYWRRYTNNFIFVVGYKKEKIIDYVKNLDIRYEFVEQKEQKGLADALYHTKEFVTDNFILVLGDCLINGDLEFPKEMVYGAGVWKNGNLDYAKENFSVEYENDLIYRMVEKPNTISPNALCGMGIYFFNKKIFDYMGSISTSDLTSIMQKMIESGEKFTPVFFSGKYLNINYTQDIEKAEEIFK